RAARRYFVTAERFNAAQAHHIGLVHQTVHVDALDDTVDGLVKAILSNGPAAVRASKELIGYVAQQPITPELRDRTARHIADIRASDEGRAGLQAFLNKTNPPWLAGDKQ
ncbi:MAG: enoyl-CoA hydratase/isomerase family protein, partial [Burkholderiales bacterium]|nr:enoyl-CoA hydratase/isomerase family protein [Burkholderiales bacterium]